jgi:hypothetical protein
MRSLIIILGVVLVMLVTGVLKVELAETDDAYTLRIRFHIGNVVDPMDELLVETKPRAKLEDI